MEQIHIDTLKEFEEEIIDNVNVSNGIINSLVIEGILNKEDDNAILNRTNTRDKTSKLLDILPRCGRFALQEFVNSLKLHYSWLSDDIEIHLRNSSMPTYMRNRLDDLPSYPENTVTRQDLEFFWTLELKQLLNRMRPGGHLAINGLKGIGKSCLVAKTLQEDKKLVSDLFHNEIYWMKFNNNNSSGKNLENEIVNQLNNLAHKLQLNPTRMQTETLNDCYQRVIRSYLNKREHKNALLILDDVTHEAIVDAFDFGCKSLIITDDLTVVRRKEPLHLQISTGFTEEESLRLFAKTLDTRQGLPKEAKKIHKQCKELPLLIGMMVAQLRDCKEQLIQDPKLWQHFLEKLRKNDPENNFIQTARNTFDLCIEKLKPVEKKRFYDLAVFNDDINIMPKTLETLWNIEEFEVIELMKIFCHKSLATKKWNQQLKCYVYGVHNMLLDHLRTKLGPETLRAKHEVLIHKYNFKCNGNFSELTLDNYIHSYIGHHLEKAGLNTLFKEIYFDLKFIEKKIINAGVNDLIIDLEKFKHYITDDTPENLEKLNDLEKFLRQNVEILTKHRDRDYLDIIQIALLNDEEGFILNQARELAIKDAKKPYFSRTIIAEREMAVDNIFTECNTHSSTERITNICFADDHNSLLWSTENGDIFQKNFTNGEIRNFYGLHGEDIKKLVVSDQEQHFLALTKKGDVKLFSLEKNDSNSENYYQERQLEYIALFGQKKRDDSLETFRVNNDVIVDVIFTNDDLIAACTQGGTVIVWNQNGRQICQQNNKFSLKKIINWAGSSRNEFFHVFTNDGILATYAFDNNRLDDISMYNPDITNPNVEFNIVFWRRLTTEPNALIVITNNEAFYIKWSESDCVLENFTTECQVRINHANERFVSAIMTYDEKYLIISKSNGSTEIWTFRNEFKRVTSCDWRLSCLDTFWMKNDNYHLLCGKENSLIYKWKLNPKIEELIPVSEPLFNAFLKPKGQNNIVARLTKDNKLIITEENETWRKKLELDLEGIISTVIFSQDGKKLIFDTIKDNKQTIYLLDIASGISNYIIKLEKTAKLIWLVSNFTVSDIVIIVEENQGLKICVYSNSRITTHTIDSLRKVIGVHEIDKNKILTVTEGCDISYWAVDPNSGELLFVQSAIPTKIKVTSSTLSANKKYLGVLTRNRKKILLFGLKNIIEKNQTENTIQLYHEIPEFNDKISCLKFSNNEKLLAVGFENGNISIVDIEAKTEICRINDPLSCVKNLNWNLDSTILMSVNSEEIALFETPRKIQPMKLNRKGEAVWKCSMQNKMYNKSLLLRIIPLPMSNVSVWVTDNLEKFLTLDQNGHVNIFDPLISPIEEIL